MAGVIYMPTVGGSDEFNAPRRRASGTWKASFDRAQAFGERPRPTPNEVSTSIMPDDPQAHCRMSIMRLEPVATGDQAQTYKPAP